MLPPHVPSFTFYLMDMWNIPVQFGVHPVGKDWTSAIKGLTCLIYLIDGVSLKNPLFFAIAFLSCYHLARNYQEFWVIVPTATDE